MRNRQLRIVVFLALLAGAARPVSAQEWLPLAVVDGLSQQLLERLVSIEQTPPDDPAAALERTREGVLRLRAGLDEWGERGALARAPRFPNLELPQTGQPHLDAIGRYQLCNAVLIKQWLDADDADARRIAALGVTGVTVAIMLLRHPYLEQGGSHAQMEAFLTGEAMEREFSRLQESQPLLDHVGETCSPVVAALVELLVP